MLKPRPGEVTRPPEGLRPHGDGELLPLRQVDARHAIVAYEPVNLVGRQPLAAYWCDQLAPVGQQHRTVVFCQHLLDEAGLQIGGAVRAEIAPQADHIGVEIKE